MNRDQVHVDDIDVEGELAFAINRANKTETIDVEIGIRTAQKALATIKRARLFFRAELIAHQERKRALQRQTKKLTKRKVKRK